MNSNQHPAAYGYQPPRAAGFPAPKPMLPEDSLGSGTVEIERKSFLLALKENARGRFLRITERKGDRHSTIIIPAPGLKDFQQMLADMLAADQAAPEKKPE